MHKLFFEAIPGLEMNEKMRAALEDVWVEKVTQSRDLRVLHIHLESEHLIHKKMKIIQTKIYHLNRGIFH